MRAQFLLILVLCSIRGIAASPSPIVQPSDPFAVTHKFKIGQITIGVSDLGGGYLNYVDLGDGKNIVSANYGRGWQGSVRDQLHGGRYNFLTGMLAPGHGKPNVLEALQNETFILFGTPDQILESVGTLRKKLAAAGSNPAKLRK